MCPLDGKSSNIQHSTAQCSHQGTLLSNRMQHNAFARYEVFTIFSEDSESFVIFFLSVLLRHTIFLGSLGKERGIVASVRE